MSDGWHLKDQVPEEPDHLSHHEYIATTTINDLLYARERLFWNTKDGRKYRLKDLADGHLDNIIKYIQRSEGNYHPRWLAFLMLEQAYRRNNDITVAREVAEAQEQTQTQTDELKPRLDGLKDY